MSKESVCIIGSGNWGSAIAKIVGNNVHKFDEFDKTVKIWVYEEMIDGQKLSDIFNTRHENIKYLPGIQIPSNVVAEPDLLQAATGATVYIFVLPHQFIHDVCNRLKGKVSSSAKAISLIKGFDMNTQGLKLMSELIKEQLQLDVSVLSGANIANEVANEKFCETTVGYSDLEQGKLFQKLFHTSYFKVNIINDVAGVELCGGLKNVVAIAAGLVDGLKLGENTKAAIMRLGLMEMRKFAKRFYENVRSETFFESCGVADIITSCSGGRHRKVSEAHVKTQKSFDELEKELLNGQKLQGTITALEIHQFLQSKDLVQEFPLFDAVYRVCYEQAEPNTIISIYQE